MSDDSEQLHRRDFLRLATLATGTGGVFYSTAMTTDALATPIQVITAITGFQNDPESSRYHYANN